MVSRKPSRRTRRTSTDERNRKVKSDKFLVLTGWFIVVVGAVIGNLLTEQKVDYLEYNIVLALLAVITYGLLVLFRFTADTTLPLFLVLALNSAFIAAICYFSGGVRSDARFLFLFPIVLSMRFGISRAMIMATFVSLVFFGMGIIGDASVRSMLANLVMFFIIAPVVAPVTSRRTSQLAYQAAMEARTSREEIEKLSILNTISSALLNYIRDSGLTAEALQGIADLFDADACWIYDYRESRTPERKLKLVGGFNLDEDNPERYQYISLDTGITGRAITTKQVENLNLTDDRILARINKFPFSHPSRKYPSRVAVPMIVREKPVGVLTIAFSTPRKLSEREMNLLQTLANQIAIAIDNALLYETQQRELNERIMLQNITETLGATDKVDELVQFTYSELRKLMPVEGFALLKSNETLNVLEPKFQFGFKTDGDIDNILSCWAVKKNKPFLVSDTRKDFTCDYCGKRTGSYVCVPLTAGGKVLGAITIGNSRFNAFTEDHISLLTTVSNQLAVAIQRATLLDELTRLAIRDPLTDAYNRGYFEVQLERELARSRRSGKPVSLVYIDLDDFKKINDSFGHHVGDAVLKQLVRIISLSIRSTDTLARIGGEEFALIFPETPKQGAIVVAEKLRKAIEREKFVGDSQTLTVQETISIGIATCPEDGDTVDALLRKADDAMYIAKERGKNQVVTA